MNIDKIMIIVETLVIALILSLVLAFPFMWAFNHTNFVVFGISDLTYSESFATLMVLSIAKS